MRCCCITLFVPPILLVGCASNNEMKRPFMFEEAKLPVGYPPPGPVGEVCLLHHSRSAACGTMRPGSPCAATGARVPESRGRF
jgi:hypothetical protein